MGRWKILEVLHFYHFPAGMARPLLSPIQPNDDGLWDSLWRKLWPSGHRLSKLPSFLALGLPSLGYVQLSTDVEAAPGNKCRRVGVNRRANDTAELAAGRRARASLGRCLYRANVLE